MEPDQPDGPTSPEDRAALYDQDSMATHDEFSAADGHWQVATHLWPTLKALGYTRGHMLTIGMDADLLAGRPPHPNRDHDSLRDLAFHSPVPPGSRWPHRGLPLGDPGGHAGPLVYDVVIVNLPYYDVIFVDDARRTEQGRHHSHLITGALEETRPGGITVALAAQTFLDHPDPTVRDQVAARADLIGTVRLPTHAMHPSLTFGPTDIVLLRRRPPGANPAGTPFTASRQVSIDGEDFHLNEYWLAHPENMLGTLARSVVPAVCTVYRQGEQDLDEQMRAAFDHIGFAARPAGLTAPDPNTGQAPTPPSSSATNPSPPPQDDPDPAPGI